jgi:hypothetical protein
MQPNRYSCNYIVAANHRHARSDSIVLRSRHHTVDCSESSAGVILKQTGSSGRLVVLYEEMNPVTNVSVNMLLANG